MKLFLLFAGLCVIGGCGSKGEEANLPSQKDSQTSAKPPVAADESTGKGKVTQDQISLPLYPGATEVAYTGVLVRSGNGDAYSLGLESRDTVQAVQDFYKTECAKLGTLGEEVQTSADLKMVSVKRAGGVTSAIRASKGKNGKTSIMLSTFYPTGKAPA